MQGGGLVRQRCWIVPILAAYVTAFDCGCSPPRTDPCAALATDTTISDVQAVQRAVDLQVGWDYKFAPARWKPAPAGAPKSGSLGTWTDVDGSGAPALHIAWESGLGFGRSTRYSRKGEVWTVKAEREQDMLDLRMKRSELLRVARVGAARRLRFIELTFYKTVRTRPWSERTPLPESKDGFPSPELLDRMFHDPDEDRIAVFRAVIAHESLQKVERAKFEDVWEVEFDLYDQLTVEQLDK